MPGQTRNGVHRLSAPLFPLVHAVNYYFLHKWRNRSSGSNQHLHGGVIQLVRTPVTQRVAGSSSVIPANSFKQLRCMDKNRQLARGLGLRAYQVTLNLLQSLSFSFRHPCQYKEKTCHTNSSVDPESSGHAQPVVQNGKGESQKKRSQPESRH